MLHLILLFAGLLPLPLALCCVPNSLASLLSFGTWLLHRTIIFPCSIFSESLPGLWTMCACDGFVLSGSIPLYKERGLHILIGDGVKQSKEGRRIPGVKKLFQESENSAKPEYIHGHMFGGLGILAGGIRNWACVPLSIRLHDDLQAASGWKDSSVSCSSHVIQMVEDAYKAAKVFGKSLLLLDRYFLTVSAMENSVNLMVAEPYG